MGKTPLKHVDDPNQSGRPVVSQTFLIHDVEGGRELKYSRGGLTSPAAEDPIDTCEDVIQGSDRHKSLVPSGEHKVSEGPAGEPYRHEFFPRPTENEAQKGG